MDVRVIAGGVWGEVGGGKSVLMVIPAGQTFYLGGGNGMIGVPPIKRVRVVVRVGTTIPSRYVLPPVSNIRLDKTNGSVTGKMTNPYSTAMNVFDAEAYVVVFDRQGRVLGGDSGPLDSDYSGNGAIKPGAHVGVGFPLPDGVSAARAAYARISVNPR